MGLAQRILFALAAACGSACVICICFPASTPAVAATYGGNPTIGGSPSGSPSLTGYDTSSVSGDGLLVYAYDTKAVLPADALNAGSSRVLAALSGGKLVQSGEVSLQFTTQGGAPIPGHPVWLAAAADDGNTAWGKATASRPQAGGLIPPQNGPLFKPQNIVQVGICADASNYATAKTATVVLNLPIVAAGAPADQSWFTAGFSSLSASNYFTSSGNSKQVAAQPGQTYVIVLSWDDTTANIGASDAWSNKSAGSGSGVGWEIRSYSTFAGMTWYDAGGGQGECGDASMHWIPGFNIFVIAIDDATHARCSLNGLHYSRLADVSPVGHTFAGIPAQDGTWSHRLGGGETGGPTGWNGGKIYAAAVIGRAMADPEIVALSSSSPRAPFSRTDLPQSVINDPALMWYVEAKLWTGTGNLTGNIGPQGSAITLTKVGSPAVTAVSEEWHRDLRNYWQDGPGSAVDSLGHVIPYTGERVVMTVPTQADLYAIGWGWWNNDLDDQDNSSSGVFINGTFEASIGGNGGGTDGQMHWFWLRDFAALSLPSFPATVELVADTRIYRGWNWVSHGSVTDVVKMDTTTFQTGTTTSRRMILIGDGQTLGGHDNGGTNGTDSQTGVHTLIRADYPGKVTAFVDTNWSVEGTKDWGNGSMIPFAKLVKARSAEGSPTTIDVVVGYSFIDYYVGTAAPSVVAADEGALLDAIHAQLPSASIWLHPPVQTGFFSTANALGYTLQQYVTPIAALATGRTWLHEFDATVPNAITFGSTNNSIPTGTGPASIKANYRAAGVY